MKWHFLFPESRDLSGYIPSFLSEANPRDARTQLNEAYAHGGGWRKFEGFTLVSNRPVEQWALEYPGDPAMAIVAYARLRGEMVIIFEHAWVAVVQSDGSYEIARMN